MKKALLLLCLLMLTAACGSAAPEPEVISEQIEVTRLVETEVTRIVEVPVEITRLVEVTRVVSPTATPRPPATATPKAPALGARDNPVPVLTPTDMTKTEDGHERSLTVTVTDIVRGDEALQMAKAANRFNDPPPEGSEFLLALIRIEYREGDGVLEIVRRDTSLVSNNQIRSYSDMAFDVPCCLDPEFDFKLFTGADVEGWLPLLVSVDDPSPLLLFGTPEKGVYFSLVK